MSLDLQGSRECRFCRSKKPAPVTRRLKSPSCWLNRTFLSTLGLDKGSLKFRYPNTLWLCLLTLSPLKNRLRYLSNNTVERSLPESQFLHRKNGRAATAAVITHVFKLCRRPWAPGTMGLRCSLELREVWASKSFLSPPGDPGQQSHD
jgi:hypothetical protein